MEPAGTVFIDSVSRLIALLLDYRKISSDECHKNRRMGCMLNLLVSQPPPVAMVTEAVGTGRMGSIWRMCRSHP